MVQNCHQCGDTYNHLLSSHTMLNNPCAGYEEASEGQDSACAGLHGAKFVAWCFSGGEDSRRHRNRGDTIEGVAVESDNSENKDN